MKASCWYIHAYGVVSLSDQARSLGSVPFFLLTTHICANTQTLCRVANVRRKDKITNLRELSSRVEARMCAQCAPLSSRVASPSRSLQRFKCTAALPSSTISRNSVEVLNWGYTLPPRHNRAAALAATQTRDIDALPPGGDLLGRGKTPIVPTTTQSFHQQHCGGHASPKSLYCGYLIR
jgi:hypothetical protein